jgi:nitroreductase
MRSVTSEAEAARSRRPCSAEGGGRAVPPTAGRVDAAALETDADVLERLLRRRHSCRAFLDRPVPRETIERILQLAQRAASWANIKPWEIVLLGGASARRFEEGLAAYAAEHSTLPDIPFPHEYRQSYQDRRAAYARDLYRAIGATSRQEAVRQGGQNFRCFGAPHVAIVTTDAGLGTYGAVDCGGYIATLMLAACSLGVDSIAQGAVAGHAPFVRSELGIPPERQIVCAVAFGYADPDSRINAVRTVRAPLSEVVTWRDR